MFVVSSGRHLRVSGGEPILFRHEAYFYEDRDEFAQGVGGFVADALRHAEPVMVALSADKLDLLRGRLGPDIEHVLFLDLGDIGRNPARLIPAWRRFVARCGAEGKRLRGVGEPIWNSPSAAELAECQLHEALLNVAFSSSPALWLLCPYEVGHLTDSVLKEARRSHRFIRAHGRSTRSPSYRADRAETVLDAPLPEPCGAVTEVAFDRSNLADVRHAVSRWVGGFIPSERAADVVLAAHELATNSVLHGGGRGTLRYWQEDGHLMCEVSDTGRIERALVGRVPPALGDEVGRGLWLCNQLCELVQVRSSVAGTVIRLHVTPPDPGDRVAGAGGR